MFMYNIISYFTKHVIVEPLEQIEGLVDCIESYAKDIKNIINQFKDWFAVMCLVKRACCESTLLLAVWMLYPFCWNVIIYLRYTTTYVFYYFASQFYCRKEVILMYIINEIIVKPLEQIMGLIDCIKFYTDCIKDVFSQFKD